MRPLRIAAGLITLVTAATACSAEPPEPPPVVVDPLDPGFVQGTDGGGDDQLAATVIGEAQRYWSTRFPDLFELDWRDLDGGVFSVDTSDPAATAPPCTAGSDDVEGNAFYCATADVIAWDRAALLPVLREHYGDAAVAVVLAHEYGHAVQHRSGLDVQGSEDPAVLEAGADCYAGSFLRWVDDGRSPHLQVDPGQLDGALRALTVFQDPLTGTGSSTAHGSAFERIAAFQDGYQDGPQTCGDPRAAQDTAGAPTDQPARDLDRVLTDNRPAGFFGRLTGTAPPPITPAREAPEACAGRMTPVAYCADPPTVVVDRAALQDVHVEDGAHAAETQLASRYAADALRRTGGPTTGRAAGERITCLTGAFTTDPGPPPRAQLDEAVRALLRTGSVSRDASGTNHLTGLDRVAAFRTGAAGGPHACGEHSD